MAAESQAYAEALEGRATARTDRVRQGALITDVPFMEIKGCWPGSS
jgi:hypothetical protein